MDGKRISKEDLISKMNSLSDIYDMVRLVEPESTSVVVLGEQGLEITGHEPCFSMWKKGNRCANCISLRACAENRKFTKFEFSEEEAYSVLAVPYTVISGENEYKVSLELVNRVQENMVFQSDGMDERAKQIMEFNMKLYQDSLTGTFNRRYYDEHRYIYDLTHTIPPKLGYVIVDVDHFKQINDTYGHQCGDELLTTIAGTLKANVRATDSVMRIGGDEFLVVMQNCDRQFVEKKKTQLKRAVQMIHLPWLGNQTPSISAGVAFTDEFTGRQEELSALFGCADKALYADKKHMKLKQEQVTVLVVDDLEMNRALARRILEERYRVMEAANGIEAVAMLNTNQIDVIITDIFMDQMNGYELMQKIKSIPHFRDIPIIAVTENSESSQRKAIESGADIYIDRPLGGFNLLNTIRRLTGSDFGRRELFDVDFLLDTIPGAVVVYKVFDTALEVVSCSRGISQITGWDADEFCREEIVWNEQSIFSADIELVKHEMGRMIRTHSRAEIIFRAYKKDGSLVWIWFQGRYIGEEDGCPIIEAILLDVSANTDMYQLILDETSAMVTIIDAETYEVVYANKRAIESSDAGEKYVGCTCYKGIHHMDIPCKDCLLLKSKHIPAEVKRVTYAGHTYKMLKKRMIWNQRKVLLEYSEDITDEVRANQLEDELNHERQKLIDQVPTGIGIYEVKNKNISQIYMNNAFYEIIKSSRDERRKYLDNPSLKSLYPEDVQKIRAEVQKLMDGRNITQCDCRLKNGDGDWIWLHAIANVVERSENYIRLYCAFYECTESKQQQLKLLQNQRAVALAEKQGRIMIWTYNIDKNTIVQLMADEEMGYPDKFVNVPNCFIQGGSVCPEDQEKFANVYKRLADGEEKVDEIYRLIDPNTGSCNWVHTYYQRMENNDAGDRMAVGFSILVNKQQEAIERYQVEQKLREQMYAHAVMYTEYNLTDGLYQGENNLTEIYLKQDWEKQSSEDYRKNMSVIVDARYLDLFVEKMYASNLLKAFARGETKVSCEYRSMPRPHRPSLWYRTTAVMAKRPDNGNVVAFIYIEEIDEEKNRQIAIESSTSDGIEIISVIQIADGKAHVVRSNYALTPGGLGEYFIYDDEFVRRSHMSVAAEDREYSYHAALLSTVLKELETKEIHQYSISTQRQNGKMKRQLFRFRYLDDRKKSIILSVSNITSIYLEAVDKKKQLEDALCEAQKSSQAKSEFYSRMSHDMRTPMNGILGLTALSEDETDVTVLKENLAKIDESGKYLLGIINDTLDIQRIESGKLTLNPEVVNCRRVIETAIEMVRSSIAAKHIDFQIVNKGIVLDCEIRIDPVRMKQIFVNLISNAIKFTPEGGKITFELECLGEERGIVHDRFTIRDNGVGMSEDFLRDKIFKSYAQEQNVFSNKYAGTGLGLSIVRRLVSLMGGTIEVESQLGVGTAFMICLDIERVEDEMEKDGVSNTTEKEKNEEKCLAGCKILLAEDHPLNAEIAKKLLEKVGCVVTWVKDGQACLNVMKLFTPGQFDVILMDWRMPVMDGLTATAEIRKLKDESARSIPIIAMTANAYSDDAAHCLAVGMNAHVAKPFEPKALYAAIAKYLHHEECQRHG